MIAGGSWDFRFKSNILKILNSLAVLVGKMSCTISISTNKEFAEFGCIRCEWKIKKSGPCKFNKNTKLFDVCLPWNL